MNADYIELQGKIDQAVIDNSTVEVTRTYVIDEQLRVERFEDGEYKFHSAKLVGNQTMWDLSNGNIIATFNDKPIVNVQCSKGGIFKGLNIRGTGKNGIDERYNVYSALSIDGNKSNSRSGSTGVRISDCTFNEVNVGSITSMNGHTQNAEMITWENIRIGKVKYGFAGCQAQEKLNRVINVGAWEECDTLFMFNRYGERTPGHWIIDGVNIAGNVDYLVHRGSHEYFPLMIKNVYAERLIGIGFWQTFLNDTLESSTIDFRYPEEMGFMPRAIIDAGGSSGGLNLKNNNIRYYGRPEIPMVFIGKMNNENNNFQGKKINVIPYQTIEGITMVGYDTPFDPNLNALHLNAYNNDYEGISYNGLHSGLSGNYNIGIY